ncbi:MAG: hypothetical protein EON58_19810 [Alphaproteobacteria bacterium]|nr:MAG: hypothetical protein EON58_19810 [Alphaproteobacteria bacterium]
MRDAAPANSDSLWTTDQTFPLPNDNFGYEASIISAGFGDMFGYYRCPHGAGAAWAVIESYPEAEGLPDSVYRVTKAIQMCISNIPFDHRAAVSAYLGQPDANGTYANGLTIHFDDLNRIANMQATLRPGDSIGAS